MLAILLALTCSVWGTIVDAALLHEPAVSAADPPNEPPVAGPELLKYTPEQIEKAYEGRRIPEAVSMYLVIARGGQLDGTAGWFHPAASRFSFEWLAGHQKADPQQPLTRDHFMGQERIFEQLDRDHDGSLTGFDLDWSDSNPWVRQSYMVNRIFRRMESDGDGLLTADELNAWFGKLSRDGQPIRFEQFRDALVAPGSGFSPGDMPSKEVLIRGFLAGEIGSLQEGPGLNDSAPDFTVRAISGRDTVKLSDRLGQLVAEQCVAKLKPSIPFYVDDIADTAGNLWSAMPACLYVIDSQGKVAWKSGRGPFGFKPEEMEQALLMLQLEESGAK